MESATETGICAQSPTYSVQRDEICRFLCRVIERSELPLQLQEAIRYGSTEPRASRWRSLLVMEVGHALGAKPEVLLSAAAAVEALHCATLSIDDLPSMDDAAKRRGLPAMHHRFNEAMAIQASLWLLGTSRTLMGSAAVIAGVSTKTAADLGFLQQRTENEMQLGQFLDIIGARGETETDPEQIARLKCGRMFALAAQTPAWLLPAHVADAPDYVEALDIFGEEIGLAYQIRDDLEDSGEDNAAANWSGANTSGRPTLVAQCGRIEADKRIGQCIDRALAALAPLERSGIDCAPVARIAVAMLGRD